MELRGFRLPPGGAGVQATLFVNEVIHLRRHHVWSEGSVQPLQEPLLLVAFDKRESVVGEDAEAFSNCFLVVIFALNQGFSRHLCADTLQRGSEPRG